METGEFIRLLKNSELGVNEAADLLGQTRQTITNWKSGKKIPKSKGSFIKRHLDKDPRLIRLFLSDDAGMSVDLLEDYVVNHFEQFLERKDFRDKVYVEAYMMANQIIEKSKKGK